MRLGEVAAPNVIGKINYKNFQKITHKFGIVYEGWPLERFCCPGDINSVPELNVLRNAFVSGAAFFRRLSDDELEQWRTQQGQAHLLAAAAAARTTPAEGPAAFSEPSVSTAAAVPTTPLDGTSDGTSYTRPPLVPFEPSTQANTPALPLQAAAITGALQTVTGNENQVVFSVNEGALVPRKPRKPRADKGKKRGPYKRGGGDADVPA